MTAGELIAQLAQHSPDTPVMVIVEDEFSSTTPVDLEIVTRAVESGGAHIELIGGIG